MTREEASKTLTQYIDYDAETPDYYEMEKACKVALKALKQAPCEDCISRDAVQNYVESHIQEINTGYGDLNNHTNRILRMIVDGIGNLPSIQPQPKTDVLDKIRAEIETKYGQCDICEYFEDYDYEENDISEYRATGNIADILQIIDKYKAESAHEVAQEIVNNNGIVDL